MNPEIDPIEIYKPKNDVIGHRFSNNNIVLEIYYRQDRTIGFRYQAWVAWRDAGNNVRSHSWQEIKPQSLIIDNILEAKKIAEAHAESIGIEFIQEWAG
jgi:hypothetical protein